MRIRPLSQEKYLQLLRTAKNQAAATVWIRGGKVLDVFLKEWREAHVVLAGERIAYIGEREPLVDEHTEIIDATGSYLVPGYIEPHAHPFQWYNPFNLNDYALARGTTTMIADNLFLFNSLPFEEVTQIMDLLSGHPVKQYFWARLDPQSQKIEKKARYTKDQLTQMLAHPLVIQAGELTDWGGILAEQEELIHGMMKARELGKRIEGHHPGASWDTLNIAAAAGVTACHESINVDELINRLRLGLYVTLRHSSIRPDLPVLIQGIRERQIPWSSRFMLTSDGSTPPMMGKGFMDYTIRVAIEAGAPATEAYVMATLNPATYYGLDAEIGSITPGRIADILMLSAPENPVPHTVMANGKVWSRNQQLVQKPLNVDLSQFSFENRSDDWLMQASADWFDFVHPDTEISVIEMLNAVITKPAMEKLPRDSDGFISLEHDPSLCYVFLLDTHSRRITRAVLRGFGENIDALASTYTASGDWIVLGRDKVQIAEAIRHLNRMNGGIVLLNQGRIEFEQRLPISGMVSQEPMAVLVEKGEEFCEFLRKKGHKHIDPIYSLLFITATHLPFIRLMDEGIYDVKKRKIIVPSSQLDTLPN
ncbi:adenine deaminase C-terminal domain-containing protein [Brevibacillus ginsengisoli]|uniref:adenine deaminase C-terminal domain-containing protein n=1 Tax=Brevibacillus ginsengisoli TaxID=363854 RepID=UPI003CE9A076